MSNQIARRSFLQALGAAAAITPAEAMSQANAFDPNQVTTVDAALFANKLPIFATIEGMTALPVPADIMAALVIGGSTAGDGKEGTFFRVASDPGSAAGVDDKFRSADRFLPNGATDAEQGGWWRRKPATYAEAKSNQWIPGREFSLPVGYGSGTAAAFNSAMEAVALRGGGQVIVPAESILLDATLDNKYADVLLRSMHRLRGHTNGSGADPFGQGAQFIATFAGTMARHRTPYASEMSGVKQRRNNGGGFQGITLNGNNIATRAFEADSVANFVHELFSRGVVGALGSAFAVAYKCGVTAKDTGDAADIQNGSINHKIRQIDSAAERAVGGIIIDGSVNANFSLNHLISLDIQHANGTAFYGVCGDNNRQIYIRSQRIRGGTGHAILCEGVGAVPGGPVGFQGNVFELVSCNAPVEVTGTDSTQIKSGVVNEICLDDDNGTAEPIAGVGSKWIIRRTRGRMKGFGFQNLLAGGEVWQVNRAWEATKAYPSAGLIVAGGSEQDILLVNGSDVWRVFVSNTTKDLTISRIAGTGSLNLPSATALKIGGQQVSAGPADSGGSGFRALRVPNA